MNKEKISKGIKIFIIAFLLLAISLLAILQWKSDFIIHKVMSSVQHQLVDSLHYSDAGMDWFRYFPSTAIHITDLNLGEGNNALIQGGDVDIVISLFPLFRDEININRLQILNGTINLRQHDGRWTYEVLKKSVDTTSESSFKTLIHSLVLKDTKLKYNDGKSLEFILSISNAKIKGGFENKKLDSDIDMSGMVSELAMENYKQTDSFPFDLTGLYTFDLNSGLQDFKEWHIQNEGLDLTGAGTIIRETDHEQVDVVLSWQKGDLEILQKWVPEKYTTSWTTFNLTGESEGQIKIEGVSSQKDTPHVTCSASVKNGGIDFTDETEDIKGLTMSVDFNSSDEKRKEKSNLYLDFKKSSLFGKSLEGKVTITNLESPTIDLSCKGTLPAGLLNLLSIPSLRFEKGTFDIDHFELHDFRTEAFTFTSFVQQGSTAFAGNDISLIYLGNKIEWPDGQIKLDQGQLDIDLDKLTWNKATTTDVAGTISSKEDQLNFTLKGTLCEGDIETSGTMTGMHQLPVFTALWKVKGIEMKQLLQSFSNFDQTFITSDNLSGKANIWAESTIPFDEKWEIITKKVEVKSAIDIRDGQLKDMKTLEDFSKYVHLDDLRDIRFNQLHNYMKIEDGKVYLPVMFIQSSAMNLSICGVHSFDQKILYNLKLNAGQVVSTKLRKNDVKKEFKQARKSGWINMYFILEGTTSNVKYQQYRTAVISGFEQSAALKESLRNYLVEKFGYDVYWLEPNEWEDIPEYE